MAKRLSAERLAEIKAREQAATAGPWIEEAEHVDHSYGVDNMDGEGIALAHAQQDIGPGGPWGNWSRAAYANAAFIAHARQDIPDLLAEIDRLNGLIKDAEWAAYDAGWSACPWCDACLFPDSPMHQPTCPAFGSEA